MKKRNKSLKARSIKGIVLLAGLVAILAATGGAFALVAGSDASPGIVRAPRLDQMSRAKIAIVDGDLAGAEEILRELLQVSPDRIEVQALLGRVLLDRGRLVEARDLLSAVLKRDDKSFDAVHGLARVYRGMGQLDLACIWFERAAKLSPQDARVLRDLGLVQRENGNTFGALASIQKSLSIDKNQMDVSSIMSELSLDAQPKRNHPADPMKSFRFDSLNPKPFDRRSTVMRALGSNPSLHFPGPNQPRPDWRNR